MTRFILQARGSSKDIDSVLGGRYFSAYPTKENLDFSNYITDAKLFKTKKEAIQERDFISKDPMLWSKWKVMKVDVIISEVK